MSRTLVEILVYYKRLASIVDIASDLSHLGQEPKDETIQWLQ